MCFSSTPLSSYDKQDVDYCIICYCSVRVCAYSVVFCFQVSYEALQYETIVFLVSSIERHYTVSVYTLYSLLYNRIIIVIKKYFNTGLKHAKN
jgi:hypothetical protein